MCADVRLEIVLLCFFSSPSLSLSILLLHPVTLLTYLLFILPLCFSFHGSKGCIKYLYLNLQY